MSSDAVIRLLEYRPPLDWAWLMRFLGRRTIAGVEMVDADAYRRTLSLATVDATHRGWVQVLPLADRPALQLEIDPDLSPVADAVVLRMRRLLDLDCVPDAVTTGLGEWAARRPGLRLPGAVDGFEVAVRAVLGQQVTVRAAHTVAGRVAARFGEPLVTRWPELARTFPAPRRLADVAVGEIAELGINAAKARTIIALARALDDGSLVLEPGVPVDATVGRLLAVPGVGDWTAQYLAMRGLGWRDAFPASDYGVMKALDVARPRDALARAEGWRPWRGYAVVHLWAGLEAAAAGG